MIHMFSYGCKGMLSGLRNKRVMIFGGSGFVGSYFEQRLAAQEAIVSIFSRRARKHKKMNHPSFRWVIGDIMDFSQHSQQINEAEVIIYSIGTLFERPGLKPGDYGTYEQAHRDSFASVLSSLHSQKQVIYVSSASQLPRYPRYLSTKREAEQLLFASTHQGYAIRPGFIVDWERRKWSIAVSAFLNFYKRTASKINKQSLPDHLRKLYEQFPPTECTSLEQLGNSVLQIIANGSTERIIHPKDITTLSNLYSHHHQS